MAGFRLWENVTIEQLLSHLTQAALGEIKHEVGAVSHQLETRLRHTLKQVLNEDVYASPACGTSTICQPSEEGRVKPWSVQSASWGLVPQADPTLGQE